MKTKDKLFILASLVMGVIGFLITGSILFGIASFFCMGISFGVLSSLKSNKGKFKEFKMPNLD